MFTTTNEVTKLTGKTVTAAAILIAQSIVEAYVGRVEAEVDVASDTELLAKATAYQAAYMADDDGKVFSQIGASQISQFGQSLSFNSKDDSPFISPLARIACRRLSWRGGRAVKVGRIFDRPTGKSGWLYT